MAMFVYIAKQEVGGKQCSIAFWTNNKFDFSTLVLFVDGKRYGDTDFLRKSTLLNYTRRNKDIYKFASEVMNDPVAEMFLIMFDLE